MKYCDACRSSYPTDFTTCPKDQTPLQSIKEEERQAQGHEGADLPAARS